EEVARATVRCLVASVPDEVPGITFLSGGQSDVDATAHLSAMNKLGPHPWELSFSYGRALQAAALKAWAGQKGNYDKGQAAFSVRVKLNGLARTGGYDPGMETTV
ncbi:MAG: class I fructose-bisphosphate aldolase, partial [Gammaproteobacteria bacterium]